MFNLLDVPGAFIQERLQSVSHSFCFDKAPTGVCAWFHFLCKHIQVSSTTGKGGVTTHAVAYHDTGFRAHMAQGMLGGALGANLQQPVPLPQADYSYTRSAFFLRTSTAGTVTLCCFGATNHVRERFERFVQTESWKEVLEQPLVLFDLVLEGLFHDVDEAVWNINKVFSALEHVGRSHHPSQLAMRSCPRLY